MKNFMLPISGGLFLPMKMQTDKKIVMSIEVTYEYEKGDRGWILIQSLDRNSAEFYKDLDDQLQAIKNPFVEPVFINTKIPGAVGVFGSAVLSDSVLFVYPRDHP